MKMALADSPLLSLISTFGFIIILYKGGAFIISEYRNRSSFFIIRQLFAVQRKTPPKAFSRFKRLNVTSIGPWANTVPLTSTVRS